MKLKKIITQFSPNPNQPTSFDLLATAGSLPMATSFKIGKIYKQLAKEHDEFYALREKKIKEYGEVFYIDEKGKETKDKKKGKESTRVKPENVDKFNKEVNELLEMDINTTFDPIKVSDLGEPKFRESEFIKMTPLDIVSNLAWLITE